MGFWEFVVIAIVGTIVLGPDKLPGALRKIVELKRKLPLYTKTENSQSFFCAGYYVVHWEDGSHSPSYCPKLITLSRYEFDGPFKTKMEMQETLRRANG